jgi:hypothetical protein
LKVTRPLAYKLQEGITCVLGFLEMGELERAKKTLLELSKLIADQTVKTIETPKESEDLTR